MKKSKIVFKNKAEVPVWNIFLPVLTYFYNYKDSIPLSDHDSQTHVICILNIIKKTVSQGA